jgi:hypothetical protein
MKYARFISETEVQFPTEDDYLEDGVTLKFPADWSEYRPSEMPTDGTIFKSYAPRYLRVSETPMSTVRRIVQAWRAVYFEPEGRVAKLIDGNLIFPDKNEYNRNGQLVCNYPNLPNSKKIEDGWMLLEETQYPTDGQTYMEKGVLIEDAVLGHKIKVVWDVFQKTPEPPYSISKLKLKKALLEIGKWEDLKVVISQDASIKEDFDLAVTLMSDDPLLLAMIQVCIQQFGLSSEQIQGLLKECKSDL